jgi:4'-phosphopantetheinyl transferase
VYVYLYKSAGRPAGVRALKTVLRDYAARKGADIDGVAAERCVIERAPGGKPYFRDFPKIKFSVSHSGAWWACLVGTAEAGLDIEDLSFRKTRNHRYLSVARRFFSADEREYVRAGNDDPEALKGRFFFVWTRKEAYLKYMGEGLGFGLDSFSIFDELPGARFETVSAGRDIQAACCCGAGETPEGLIFIKQNSLG